MTRLYDPIDLDRTRIRVPDMQHEDYLDGSQGFSFGTKVVPAKMIEEPCPHCGGTGKVEVKVPR